MPKDRTRRRFLASDVQIVVGRSSEHPVDYAIVLPALRGGHWRTVRTFDNAHDPSEHNEHTYVGLEKQSPTVPYGPVNNAMDATKGRRPSLSARAPSCCSCRCAAA